MKIQYNHVIDDGAGFAPYNNVWFIEHDLSNLNIEDEYDLP